MPPRLRARQRNARPPLAQALRCRGAQASGVLTLARLVVAGLDERSGRSAAVSLAAQVAALLRAGLPGCAADARWVRGRLVPGVW